MARFRTARSAGFFCTIVALLLSATVAPALVITHQYSEPNEYSESDSDEQLQVEIRSRSGAPLLLEFLISDPARALRSVEIESRHSTARFELSPADRFELRLIPFQNPGVYDLTLTLVTETQRLSRSLEVGFIDYVWGRDNFRFSNAESIHGSIRPYSAVLFPWVETRFGPLAAEEKAVILDFAYRIFGGTLGRCYAFSVGQIYYRRNPEQLPQHYDSVYDIREPHRSVQLEMNMLQNDVVFDYFVLRGYDPDAVQTTRRLRTEVETLMAEIGKGNAAAFGYLGAQRHHSMVAYGYIKDARSDRVSFIVANNWGTENNQNAFSQAAEQIAVDLRADADKGRIAWLDSTIPEYLSAEQLFHVEVLDEYRHNHEQLSQLLSARRSLLRREQLTLLVVEEARDAVLRDPSGSQAGRLRGRELRDIADVDYTRIENVHIWSFPTSHELELELTAIAADPQRRHIITSPNLFLVSHSGAPGSEITHAAVYMELDIPDNEKLVLQIPLVAEES